MAARRLHAELLGGRLAFDTTAYRQYGKGKQQQADDAEYNPVSSAFFVSCASGPLMIAVAAPAANTQLSMVVSPSLTCLAKETS